MFRKFNVGLPSSAAVERLFSYGGMICSAKRKGLTNNYLKTSPVAGKQQAGQ